MGEMLRRPRQSYIDFDPSTPRIDPDFALTRVCQAVTADRSNRMLLQCNKRVAKNERLWCSSGSIAAAHFS
tara:strand:- start:596 stop:808 length:213 start_codon:yes stop_codon:yes gene_type:complete